MSRCRRSLGRSGRRLVLAGALTLVGACGDADDGAVAPPGSASTAGPGPTVTGTASPDSSVAPPEASNPTSGPSASASPTDGAGSSGTPAPGAACPTGELPAVGAIDVASGEVRWMACSPAEMHRSVLGATDDVLVVSEAHQTTSAVFALDPDDGAERWRWEALPVRRPPGPVAGSGIVVLSTGSGSPNELIGVDAMTGAERWRVSGPLEVLGSSEQVVAVERAVDLAGSEPVRGLDRTTGEEIWVSDVRQLDNSGVDGGVQSTAVWQDTLIVPTGATATAIDLRTGDEAWSSWTIGTPYAADVAVIGADPVDGPSAAITAADPTTGDDLWSAPGRLAYGQHLAVGAGVVVVDARDGNAGLIAYEQDSGVERWRVESPLDAHDVVGETVISLWEQGIDARSTRDGAVRWQLTQPFGTPFQNDLLANSSTVFVALNSLPWTD